MAHCCFIVHEHENLTSIKRSLPLRKKGQARLLVLLLCICDVDVLYYCDQLIIDAMSVILTVGKQQKAGFH